MPRTVRLVQEAARCILRQRVRSAMMLLATTVGVTALVIITAMGRGTQESVLNSFEQLFAGNTMFIRAGGVEFGAGTRGARTRTTLTLADLEALRSALPAVTTVDPMLVTVRDVSTETRTTRSMAVEGHGLDAEALWARPAARGAYFSATDLTSSARVALIGTVSARELFGGRDPIGQQVRVGNLPFEIIGMLGAGGIDPHGVDRDDALWIPLSTMQRRVLNVDFVTTAKLGFAPGTDLDLMALEVGDVLRREHKLAPGVPNDFALYTPLAVQQRIQETNRTFTVLLPLATLCALIVGAFVVANLMLLTVSDRRPELGVRKAMGARASDIGAQIMIEATLITSAGGGLALLIAYGVLQIASIRGGTAIPLPWSVAGLGAGLSIVVGVAAGFVPGRRAAALDPVEALR